MGLMKECFKCGETKPLDEFYKHPQMADGHLNKCKKCNRRDVRLHRQDKIEKYRAYDRERGARMDASRLRSYRARCPEKAKAHRAVAYRLRTGDLSRPESCERCGSDFHIHAHHDDYSKPLDIMWLCASCHKQRHRQLGWGYAANLIDEEVLA